MISAFQIWTSLGSLIGHVIDYFTSDFEGRNCYLIPLGVIYVIPVIMSIGLFFIPESPRWLLQHGQDKKAHEALRWLRPFTEAELESEIREVQDGLALENEIHKNAAIVDMFVDPVDRRRTVLAVCALSCQGACGAMYIICE